MPQTEQCWNPCPVPVFQDLSTHRDWRLKNTIVNLPIRFKGDSKRNSGSLSRRSDSGERCEVKRRKARKNKRFQHLSPQSPSTFHRFFSFAPLSTIWTLETGYNSGNSLAALSLSAVLGGSLRRFSPPEKLLFGWKRGEKRAEKRLLDCKTVRFFEYSSTREQPNKRSGTKLKTQSKTGERR